MRDGLSHAEQRQRLALDTLHERLERPHRAGRIDHLAAYRAAAARERRLSRRSHRTPTDGRDRFCRPRRSTSVLRTGTNDQARGEFA